MPCLSVSKLVNFNTKIRDLSFFPPPNNKSVQNLHPKLVPHPQAGGYWFDHNILGSLWT